LHTDPFQAVLEPFQARAMDQGAHFLGSFIRTELSLDVDVVPNVTSLLVIP
jgi:hypothetical protein